MNSFTHALHLQKDPPKYGMFDEESAVLRENVPYVKLHRYNQKYPYPNFNSYVNNG